MIIKEIHIYTTIEKIKNKAYIERVIKNDSDNIIYQEKCEAGTMAYNESPIRKFEMYLTGFPIEKTQCGCNRCGNFRDFSDTFGKYRIYLFSKFHQFVIKFFKIPL